MIWQPLLGKTDHEISFGLAGQLSNTSRCEFALSQNYVYLFNSLDPTGNSSEELEQDTDYNHISFEAMFRSDSRKDFAYNVRTYFGKYFNGTHYGLSGKTPLRFILKGFVSLDYNYNLFDMPHLEELKSTFLIEPMVDYKFTRKLFFITFFAV